MTTPNLEQIDQFAEIAWRKACDRMRAAEGNSPTTAKWEDVITQDEWRSMVTDVIAAIRDSGLTVIALPEGKDYERICRSEQITVEDRDDGVPPIKWETPYDLRRLAPSAAHDLGAALIAAAQVAERNNP